MQPMSSGHQITGFFYDKKLVCEGTTQYHKCTFNDGVTSRRELVLHECEVKDSATSFNAGVRANKTTVHGIITANDSAILTDCNAEKVSALSCVIWNKHNQPATVCKSIQCLGDIDLYQINASFVNTTKKVIAEECQFDEVDCGENSNLRFNTTVKVAKLGNFCHLTKVTARTVDAGVGLSVLESVIETLSVKQNFSLNASTVNGSVNLEVDSWKTSRIYLQNNSTIKGDLNVTAEKKPLTFYLAKSNNTLSAGITRSVQTVINFSYSSDFVIITENKYKTLEEIPSELISEVITSVKDGDIAEIDNVRFFVTNGHLKVVSRNWINLDQIKKQMEKLGLAERNETNLSFNGGKFSIYDRLVTMISPPIEFDTEVKEEEVHLNILGGKILGKINCIGCKLGGVRYEEETKVP